MGKNYLVISDTQIPFHHPKALDFCIYLKKHYNISDDDVYHVGDELDHLHGGMWKKDPNGIYSAVTEHNASMIELKRWYAAFPKMKLCLSNHGSRWLRKATEAEIPSYMLRKYEDVIQSPYGWIWKKQWIINEKHPFSVVHGDDFGGQFPHVNAALINGMSTCIGHFHSVAGVEFKKTNGLNLWAMATGSLIDFEQYAFAYGRNAKFKPQIGCGIVLNKGRLPVWIPIE